MGIRPLLPRLAVFLALLGLAACQPKLPAAAGALPTLQASLPAADSPPLATASALPSPARSEPSSASSSATATLQPSATVQPSATMQPSATVQPAATLQPTSTPSGTTTLLFTGVIVPACCVQAAIDERKDPNFPYAEVREMISSADLAVGTLNATISDYPPHTGCKRTYVLVGSAENADALAHAGFDVISVATNHIKNCGLANCGERAFLDTLDNLRRVRHPAGRGGNEFSGCLSTGGGHPQWGALRDRFAGADRAYGLCQRGGTRHCRPDRRQPAGSHRCSAAGRRCGHCHAALGTGGRLSAWLPPAPARPGSRRGGRGPGCWQPYPRCPGIPGN